MTPFDSPAHPRLTLSVALATFNGSRFVAAQIASILAQHTLPDEIVVSDDNSADDTVAVVRSALAAAPATVKVTVRESSVQLGVTANFARAIELCTGEIVVLCDQDDLWQPTRISAALSAFEIDSGLLLQHADARLIDELDVPLGTTLFAGLGVTPAHRAAINDGNGKGPNNGTSTGAFALYLRRNLVTGATVMFRRALLQAALPFPSEWIHDEWLAIIAAATGRVAVSTAVGIDYRQHSTNVIGVTQPTLRYKISRLLKTTATRNQLLAVRAQILAERLEGISGVSPVVRTAAWEKTRFESERAKFPDARIARLPAIWRAARGGRYRRYASRAQLDIVRDLLRRPA